MVRETEPPAFRNSNSKFLKLPALLDRNSLKVVHTFCVFVHEEDRYVFIAN